MVGNLFSLLMTAFGETLYMVFVSTFFAVLIGFPLGIILFLTQKGHLKEQSTLHKTLGAAVNIGRSFPFAILMVALIPFTRWLIGTSLGTTASIVPLSIAAAPFIARQVENCFNEIGKEILEATIVMGSSTWQIVYKALLFESLPSLIQALTLTIINLIGYSAMAGLVGGGGLGTVAIQYGYQRFDGAVMFWTVALLILLVEIVQTIGARLTLRLQKKRGKVHG